GHGEFGYGLERGGVNIEHGWNNRILQNTFRDNACGVHLWWDPDEGLLKRPWARANAHGVGARMLPSGNNIVADNTFDGDELAIHLRDSDPTVFTRNVLTDVAEDVRVEGGAGVIESDDAFSIPSPSHTVYGTNRPVGARPELRGRDKIVMTEWFPWDHEGPLVREVDRSGFRRVFALHNLDRDEVVVDAPGLTVSVEQSEPGRPGRVILEAPRPGVFAYTIESRSGPSIQTISGSMVAATWEIAAFTWPKQADEPTPPPDLDAWRTLAGTDAASHGTSDSLRFGFGWGGPSEADISFEITDAKLGGDYFGLIARTRIPLEAGRWRVTMRSDDGVRVIVAGEVVVENWTHHGPTVDTGTFEVSAPGEVIGGVEIVVEHFEIFGYAVLEFTLERVDD
ncbi:MAG: hypothetical protein IID31_14010, partial [Planctomycetes bacterium]|nr:hypothetical protein [Planctomycetota bacterium]